MVEGLEVGLRGVYVAVPRKDKRIDEDGIEVQDLEEGSLPHESLQGGRPPLPDGLETVQVSAGLLVQFRSALGLVGMACSKIAFNVAERVPASRIFDRIATHVYC